MAKAAAGKGARTRPGRGIALAEDDARHLLLVRAAEMRDRDEQLLTREDRTQADAFAREAASGEGRRAPQVFLAARSRFAVQRLEARHPGIARALKLSRFPRWLFVIPGAAFVLGVLSNELDGGSRMELLAFPLLGVIIWNLIVYAGILLGPIIRLVRGRDDEDRQPRRQWWQILGNPLAALGSNGSGGGASTLSQGVLGDFAHDWARASAKLNASRIALIFHLAAALFAIGLVAGIFLRALTTEYRAGWESTFLGAGEVEALLSLLLGPASLLTGIAIPDESGIAALRWTGEGAEGIRTGGANAGPWIILWTATVIGVVAVPRLLLAWWQAVRASITAGRIRVPGRDDFYVRRLLRSVGKGASGGGIRVTPYAYTPDGGARSSLQTALRDVIGEGAEVTIDPACPYGAEEDWLARIPPDEDADLHIVLFSLSATPEAENHATFVRLLREFYDSAGQGVRVAALVDEQPFRAHFAGRAGLDRRIEERLESWSRMMAGVNAPMLSLSLDGHPPRDVVERLENTLLGQEAR
ncbi:DUF2868 domain-containing protein [Erythrobacteraceae bacterium WH01K]|nr:DUF2868 domain-containing protein [Erythrobacteraceae bacterium WH01K]